MPEGREIPDGSPRHGHAPARSCAPSTRRRRRGCSNRRNITATCMRRFRAGPGGAVGAASARRPSTARGRRADEIHRQVQRRPPPPCRAAELRPRPGGGGPPRRPPSRSAEHRPKRLVERHPRRHRLQPPLPAAPRRQGDLAAHRQRGFGVRAASGFSPSRTREREQGRPRPRSPAPAARGPARAPAPSPFASRALSTCCGPAAPKATRRNRNQRLRVHRTGPADQRHLGPAHRARSSRSARPRCRSAPSGFTSQWHRREAISFRLASAPRTGDWSFMLRVPSCRTI